MNTEAELIASYIEQNPNRPGLEEARLKTYGVSIWAIIGYLKLAVGGNIDRVARDYGVPREAVEAAIAYYHHHRCSLDARIAENSTDVDDILDAA